MNNSKFHIHILQRTLQAQCRNAMDYKQIQVVPGQIGMGTCFSQRPENLINQTKARTSTVSSVLLQLISQWHSGW